MKYKNPRLKHVKKIENVCARLIERGEGPHAQQILDQCNLLLETKKKKKYNLSKSKKVLLLVAKNDNLYRLFEDNTWDVYRSGELEPSSQPEIERVNVHIKGGLFTGKQVYKVDELVETINALVDQVNKLTKTK